MSLITDVVVVAMFGEDAAIAEVNKHLLAADIRRQQLRPLNMDAAGGAKFITAQVYAASFNYVDLSALREALLAAPWRIPDSVTICIDGEADDGERLWPGMP